MTPPRGISLLDLRSKTYAIPSLNCKTTQSSVTSCQSEPLGTVLSKVDR